MPIPLYMAARHGGSIAGRHGRIMVARSAHERYFCVAITGQKKKKKKKNIIALLHRYIKMKKSEMWRAGGVRPLRQRIRQTGQLSESTCGCMFNVKRCN